MLRSLTGQDRVIVSEPFANKHGVHAGDTLTLPLGDRSRRASPSPASTTIIRASAAS